MVKIAVLAVAAVVAAAVAADGPRARARAEFGLRATGAASEVSTNWAGYAAIAPAGQSVTFADVTGTWVQPQGICTAGRADASAFWVGLGGYSDESQALEQLGTASECDGSGGVAVHYAWWEVVPAPVVRIPLKVRPGDTITAAVVVRGQKVTMSLKNVTRRTRFSKTMVLTQALDVSSAEWIAEAPASCSQSGRCRTIPLTNFGTVTFSRAAAIGNGHPGTISDPAWTVSRIDLVTQNGASGRLFDRGDPLGPGVGAIPGAVTADGRGFTVAWRQNAAAPGE